MKQAIKQWIERMLWGQSQGIHVSNIRTTVHTTYPDKTVPVSQMHEVVHGAIMDTYEKLKKHK